MRTKQTLTALSGLLLGVAAQNEGAFNFSVNAIQDSSYVAAECTTALCTVYITEIRETTYFETVTEYEVSLTTQWTTEWTTSTVTKTFETSYPYTTTTVVHCPEPTEEPEPTGYPVPTYRRRTPEHDPVCLTETVTEWKTETTTQVTTEWFTTVVPTSIHVPTTVEVTIPTTITTTRSKTIWKPTTYTTEIPVTVTSGATYVSISTTTVTTSVPTISFETEIITETITKPGETITEPGETITEPAETITLPGNTVTLPATTIISTVIVEGPEVTTTITEDGEIITTTLPGSTVITTATQIIPPSTVTQPPSTITVTPLVEIILCPEPTGSSRPYDPKSDKSFGCDPGFVCNPPKPDDCNFWARIPGKEYICEPQDCIPAPPLRNVTWVDGKTGYYPPGYGYFDLNPEAFGLSYDIFEYHLEAKIDENGEVVTVTTGNWESQASLTEIPRSTSSASSTPSPTSDTADIDPFTERLLKKLMRRALPLPALCFDTCNNAWRIAEGVGKTDALCDENGDFQQTFGRCERCISGNNETRAGVREYIQPVFLQYVDYCEDSDTEPQPTGPDSAVEEPTLSTTSQGGITSSTTTPVETTTTTEEETETESSTTTPASSQTESESETTSTPSTTPSITPSNTPGNSTTPSTAFTPGTETPSSTPGEPTLTLPVVPSTPVEQPTPTTPVVLPPGSAASRFTVTGVYYALVATLVSLFLGAILV